MCECGIARVQGYNIGSKTPFSFETRVLPRRAPDAGQVALFCLELEAMLCAVQTG